MIERYSRPEMSAIWTDENRYQAWLEVEILACEAWAELGVIPKEDVKVMRETRLSISTAFWKSSRIRAMTSLHSPARFQNH